MKRLLLVLVLSAICYSQPKVSYSNAVAGGTYPANCKLKDLASAANEKLKPGFIYDGARIIKFKPRDEPYEKHIVLPLYEGVSYKYVFNRSAYPKGAEINIYNGSTSARLLFSSADFDESETILEYKTKKSVQLLYIEFNIPAASEVVGPGCICLSAGYKLQ